MSENNNNTQWQDPQPREKKSGGSGAVKGLIALALVLVIGIGVYASGILKNFGLGKGSKNQQVAESITSLATGENNKFTEEWLGNQEVAQKAQSSLHTEGNLELVSLNKELIGQNPIPNGVGLSFVSNTAADKGNVKIGLGLKGTDLVTAQIYADANKVQLAVPALFKEVITADISGDLKAKIKASPVLKDKITDEQIDEFIAGMDSAKASAGIQGALLKMTQGDFSALMKFDGLKTALTKFRDSWKIEDAPARTIKYNGKDESFKGFKSTITKESVATLMEDIRNFIKTDEAFKKEYLDSIMTQTAKQAKITKEEAYKRMDDSLVKGVEEFKNSNTANELTFTTYSDKDGKLVAFHSEIPVVANEQTDAAATKEVQDFAIVDIERNGGDFMNQNMKISFTSKNDPNSKALITSTGSTTGTKQVRDIKVNITQKGQALNPVNFNSTIDKSTGELTALLNIKEQEKEVAKVDIKGKVIDVVKGKSATYDLSKIDIIAQGQPVASLKAKFKYNTEGVQVTGVEGTPMDIFKATEEDLKNISTQVQQNAMKLIGPFMQGGQQ